MSFTDTYYEFTSQLWASKAPAVPLTFDQVMQAVRELKAGNRILNREFISYVSRVDEDTHFKPLFGNPKLEA